MEDIKEYLNTKRILNINHSSLFTSVHPRILFHIKILHFKMEFNYDSQKKKNTLSHWRINTVFLANTNIFLSVIIPPSGFFYNKYYTVRNRVNKGLMPSIWKGNFGVGHTGR